MDTATKLSGGPSRRGLLTGGLAGGFLLAFHLPVRAANEPVPMADAPEGPFAPNAFIRIDDRRQDHARHAAGRDGPGHLYGGGHDPRRGARRGLRPGGAAACAARREALRQSRSWAFRPPAAPPPFALSGLPLRKAGAGARAMLVQAAAATVAGRAGELHGVERAGDPRRQRPQARLRRPGRGRGQARRRRPTRRSRIPRTSR